MSIGEHIRVIQQWFDAVNNSDILLLDKLADEFFSADFTWHDPRMPDSGYGPQIVKEFIHQILEENTDVLVTVSDIFSAQDKVAYRFSVTMTNKASRERMNVQLLAIDRFVEGRIAEEWQLSAAGKW